MKKALFFSALLLAGFGGRAMAIDQVDGVYQIATAQDLSDFADLVNNGQPSINAVLTADIDFSAYNKMIGNGSYQYSGTFDGQGHKVTINITSSSDDYQNHHSALFLRVNGGTVKNLAVDGTSTHTGNYEGGSSIIGEMEGGAVLENCVSYCTVSNTREDEAGAYAGGLVCRSGNATTMRNCAFYGKLVVPNGTTFGGLFGYHQDGTTRRKGSYNIVNNLVDMEQGTFTSLVNDICQYSTARYTTGSVANNYYVSTGGLQDDVNKLDATKSTAADLASGKLAYLLNGSADAGAWHQKIGVDARPLPFGDESTLVYYDSATDTYYNKGGSTESDITVTFTEAGKSDDGKYYASLYSNTAAYTVPTGVEAKTYRVEGGQLLESKTYAGGDIIPAGQAVIISTANLADATFAVATGEGVKDNSSMLFGTETDQTVSEDGYIYYILATSPDNEAGKAGFYWSVEGGKSVNNKAGKAYLRVPEANAAGVKGFTFGGNTTGITSINNEQLTIDNSAWYTLDGRKLNAQPMQKGVYIHNGKVVIM